MRVFKWVSLAVAGLFFTSVPSGVSASGLPPLSSLVPNLVCRIPHVAQPSSRDPVIQQVVGAIESIAKGPLVTGMAQARGFTYEFCWIEREGQYHELFKGPIGTSFWSATDEQGRSRSGMIYTLDMLNRVLALSGRPENALLPALFVLYHEISHASITFGLASGELAGAIRDRQLMFTLMPLADKYRGREEQLFQLLQHGTNGSEAFADCYGAYMLGIAMLVPMRADATPWERFLRQQFNQQGFENAMNLTASIASQLVGQDEHGTARERQSFVRFGVNAAAHYLPFMQINPLGAANSAMFACANMAYDHEMQKSSFRSRTGLNGEYPAPAFNSATGY